MTITWDYLAGAIGASFYFAVAVGNWVKNRFAQIERRDTPRGKLFNRTKTLELCVGLAYVLILGIIPIADGTFDQVSGLYFIGAMFTPGLMTLVYTYAYNRR